VHQLPAFWLGKYDNWGPKKDPEKGLADVGAESASTLCLSELAYRNAPAGISEWIPAG
jgi:hypothetical protein